MKVTLSKRVENRLFAKRSPGWATRGSEVVGEAGPAAILSFVLNGIITVFTAMVYTEFRSAIPEAGGGYLWVKEGLPGPNAFLSGWMSWFAHAVAVSLYGVGFGGFIYELLQVLLLDGAEEGQVFLNRRSACRSA